MYPCAVASTPGIYSGLGTFRTEIGTWLAPPMNERMAAEVRSARRRFEQLAASWEEETRFSSSVEEMTEHPAYQEIIAMGDAALPLIMARLVDAPDHWHIALMQITHDDPVPEGAYGDLDLLSQAWLEWWDRHSG